MTDLEMKTLTEINPSLLACIDEAVTAKTAEKYEDLQSQIKSILEAGHRPEQAVSNRATIVVFSGDFDKLFSAFTISSGAASMGMDVSMYFAFWGLTALKKKTTYRGKSITEKLMGFMLPSGPDRVPVSRMNMLGMGPAFFKYVMKKKNVTPLPDLIAAAQEMGVHMVACEMSMDVMGIRKEELIEASNMVEWRCIWPTRRIQK
jgi:peroxiredoxin family protein